ncbi:MAG: hypothetical protein JNJ58_00600 [Chitinophagaceae bacterium]|nr:hypothetical protein [Chitinophagaceae bacterium]
MNYRIFLFLLSVYVIGCNDDVPPQVIHQQLKTLSLSDSEVAGIRLCTEIPSILADSIKNGKQASSLINLNWPRNTQILYVRFLDGDPVIQEKVKQAAGEWENYCGKHFSYEHTARPDITISFRQPGSWSKIGKASRECSPSMNLGWLTLATPAQDLKQIVLHEFGHALGLIHEHQNPDNNPIHWNKEITYAYYQKTQGWSREKTDKNLFQTYDETLMNGGSFDPKSIMLYAIPKSLTTDSFSTTWNHELSDEDKKIIGILYPKKS